MTWSVQSAPERCWGRCVVYPESNNELLDWLAVHCSVFLCLTGVWRKPCVQVHLNCGFYAGSAGEGREHCRSSQPSRLLWVTAHEGVRPQKGRKECPLVQWLGPSLCECQSLLCSRWGMLEYVLICQQCMWAAAHSGTQWRLLTRLVSQSPKVGSGLISHIVIYTSGIPTWALKFWLKLGFYPLAWNPLVLVT